MKPRNDPDGLEPLPGPTNVVRLTDVLHARRHGVADCEHQRTEADVANRRVVCLDCSREVDPFEALVAMAGRGSQFQSTYDAMIRDYHNLAGWVPRLRNLRTVESWYRRGQLPVCAHCRAGLTAEELGGAGFVSEEFELRRRQNGANAASQ